MKKLLLPVAAALVILTSCGPSQNDAIKYNDTIMDMIENLKVNHNMFMDQIDGHNIDSLKITHKLFSDKSSQSLEESKKIGPFADKKEFSDVVVEYFTTIHSIAHGEGKEMVDIMSKDTAQITEEDYNHIQELATKFDDSYSNVYDKLKAAQVKFSSEWKFALTEK